MGVNPSLTITALAYRILYDIIERNDLILPEGQIEDADAEAGALLKSSFDMIWNATGWPASPNYDSNGVWIGDKK